MSSFDNHLLNLRWVSAIIDLFNILIGQAISFLELELVGSASLPDEDSLVHVKNHDIIWEQIVLSKVWNRNNLEVTTCVVNLNKSWFEVWWDTKILKVSILLLSSKDLPEVLWFFMLLDNLGLRETASYS